MWGIEKAKSILELQKTLSNAIKRILERIEALEASAGSSSGGTDPQTAVNTANIATNTANIGTNTSNISGIDGRVTTVEANIGSIDFSDLIRVGSDTRNADGTYTISFNTPFVNGTDADIQVVLNREASDTSNAMLAFNPTKTGFSVNRNNSINGDQTVSYIAINGFYL